MRPWLRHLPNLITALRILLVIPVATALLRGELLMTLGLFVIAAGSDLVDGFLAKRFGWQSALGGILDPIADKLLLGAVFVVLGVRELVPVWLVATVVLRDAIIVCGAIIWRLYLGPIEAHPSIISKLNTLCQGLFIVCVLARVYFAMPASWIIVTLGALTFTTTVVSGIDYVLTYGRAALDARHAAHARNAIDAGRGGRRA